MSPFDLLRADPAFAALLRISTELGSEPLQVQGPGGNTSLKLDGAMLVKASGTWLADAAEQDIMVPVEIEPLRQALARGDASADNALAFVPSGDNPSGLRPSIETTVHAVLDWPVVLHTHCVATIALAVRQDAEGLMARKLAGLGAVFIPYTKPGSDLARAIQKRVEADTRVLILGNHGLVVGGDDPAATRSLLREVSKRLEPQDLAEEGVIDPAFAADLQGTGWQPVPHAATHAIAHDKARLDLADGRTLYPDHLIFLGPGIAVAQAGENVGDAAARASLAGAARKLVLVPGRGAAVPSDASPSMLALARSLGDVMLRADTAAPVTRLTEAQEAELLNWDAEQYRQALEKQRAPSP